MALVMFNGCNICCSITSCRSGFFNEVITIYFFDKYLIRYTTFYTYRLRVKGYGVGKGIPTLIIAVSGIDDALSVAVFGILASILFSEDSGLGYQISQAPVCIFGGLIFGVLWGCLAKIVPEKGDEYVVPIRTLMLFGGGLLAIYGSEELLYEGAGPLGCVFAAFTSSYFWCNQG